MFLRYFDLTECDALHLWSLRVRQISVHLIDDLLFHLQSKRSRFDPLKSVFIHVYRQNLNLPDMKDLSSAD